MTEGIEYNSLGTVDVTFDDKTYHLGRPKLKQFRYFSRRMGEITKETNDRLTELSTKVAETIEAAESQAPSEYVKTFHEKREAYIANPTDKPTVGEYEKALAEMIAASPQEVIDAHEVATEEMTEFVKRPFWETTSKLTAEIFDQLGDPLPDDIEEWPAWLAVDVTLPGNILNHWRNVPKASGSNGANP